MIRNISHLASALGVDVGATEQETISRINRSVYKSTECGAWVHLGDTGADVTIGSIVENSDVDVVPETLTFPFTLEDWNRAVAVIEDEADRLWEEANAEEAPGLNILL